MQLKDLNKPGADSFVQTWMTGNPDEIQADVEPEVLSTIFRVRIPTVRTGGGRGLEHQRRADVFSHARHLH